MTSVKITLALGYRRLRRRLLEPRLLMVLILLGLSMNGACRGAGGSENGSVLPEKGTYRLTIGEGYEIHPCYSTAEGAMGQALLEKESLTLLVDGSGNFRFCRDWELLPEEARCQEATLVKWEEGCGFFKIYGRLPNLNYPYVYNLEFLRCNDTLSGIFGVGSDNMTTSLCDYGWLATFTGERMADVGKAR